MLAGGSLVAVLCQEMTQHFRANTNHTNTPSALLRCAPYTLCLRLTVFFIFTGYKVIVVYIYIVCCDSLFCKLEH